jgi:glutamyl-tRNA(Gln) amidotransferase subunit E
LTKKNHLEFILPGDSITPGFFIETEGDMKLDYEGLGFKAGLEVHHQLDTKHKLFCRCPVKLTNREHDAELLRHMRPTLSELGEYDGTALMEFKTRKDVVYRIFGDLNCTYEMDDTPPFLINEKALDIAIAIAETFHMSLVDEVHITRKQYLDGSIPTGFQRTAIIGVGGSFILENQEIGILHMSVEEDSCREVSDRGHCIVFKADRLGIPLVELVTAPNFKTPEDAGKGAETIRRALWNLGMVRRGPGSVRHDVNCSVRGGTRIEIKGVPRIKDIPLLLHNEAMRQKTLLQIKDTLRSRAITADIITPRTADVTRLLRNCENSLLNNQKGHRIVAIKLKGFGGLLSVPVQEHAVFADEFAGRIRVIACLDIMPNMLYPDSPHADGITPGLWRKVRKRLGATHHDEVLLLYGPDQDVETAVSEVYIRACEATRGVPSETRQPLRNGSNDFERILPGPDRMYPDTDHPPLPLDDARIHAVISNLPEQPWIREQKYKKLGLPADLIKPLAISSLAPIFDEAYQKYPSDLIRIAEVLGRWIPALKKKKLPVQNLTKRKLMDIFSCWNKGLFYREAFIPLLSYMAKHPETNCKQALKKNGIIPADSKEITAVLKSVIDTIEDRIFTDEQARTKWLAGQAMETLRGRVNGAQLLQMIEARASVTGLTQ